MGQPNIAASQQLKKSFINNNSESQNGFRQIKSRVSRFNFSKEEQGIYQKFAQIMAQYDEENMKDLIECLMKEARDIQSNNGSAT